MKHIKLFENFLNEDEDDLTGLKAPGIKGLYFSHGSDYGDHYVVVTYKKPFFGKALLTNGDHKFTFVQTAKRPRRGNWFDENKKEVTDETLLDALTYFINAQGDKEIASLTSGS